MSTPITLYNTLSRKKQIFQSLKRGVVGLYTCGPTVYSFAHIGNLRTYIFEDVLARTLEYNGYKVKHIMNITDVEDKIIRDAKKSGKTIFEFVKPYEKAFFEDLRKLNIKKAFKYPKATAHTSEMIKLISMLLKKGLAYKAGSSIYFDISKFKNYGQLSGLKQRQLKAGARVDADEYTKESVEDFVLWKAKKPGEPSWKAPFGEGRPGWHIECSAMSMKYLGASFDIHAGGVDLIFPHHENEIAQSEGATGRKFVNYFIEGEHLMVNGEKMAKSLDNVFTLRDIEAKGFDPLAFRYLVLTAHYRTKLNFTWKSLQAAQNSLDNLKEIFNDLKLNKIKLPPITQKAYGSVVTRIVNNDLDTPALLAWVWKLLKNTSLKNEGKLAVLLDADKILGLGLDKLRLKKVNIPPVVQQFAQKREKLRTAKKWAEADKIRQKIKEVGWSVDDTASGPQLKPVEKH